MEQKLTITYNRIDGSERAKFDNLEDALLFANALMNLKIKQELGEENEQN